MITLWLKREENILVRRKHLERRHDLRQRHALVAQPLLVVVDAVHQHEEVLVGALVVDLDLGCSAAGHFVLCVVFVWVGFEGSEERSLGGGEKCGV